MNEIKSSQLDEVHTQVEQLQSKNSVVESMLAAREQDLVAADIKYRKCVEKAKEIIKCYDPKGMITGRICPPLKYLCAPTKYIKLFCFQLSRFCLASLRIAVMRLLVLQWDQWKSV